MEEEICVKRPRTVLTSNERGLKRRLLRHAQAIFQLEPLQLRITREARYVTRKTKLITQNGERMGQDGEHNTPRDENRGSWVDMQREHLCPWEVGQTMTLREQNCWRTEKMGTFRSWWKTCGITEEIRYSLADQYRHRRREGIWRSWRIWEWLRNWRGWKLSGIWANTHTHAGIAQPHANWGRSW